jgi:hypothetical protein
MRYTAISLNAAHRTYCVNTNNVTATVMVTKPWIRSVMAHLPLEAHYTVLLLLCNILGPVNQHIMLERTLRVLNRVDRMARLHSRSLTIQTYLRCFSLNTCEVIRERTELIDWTAFSYGCLRQRWRRFAEPLRSTAAGKNHRAQQYHTHLEHWASP